MLRGTLQVLSVVVGIIFAATGVNAQPLSFARDDIAANRAPRAIASADLTGDGWPDLILAGTNPPTVTVLLNHGVEDGDDPHHFFALQPIPVSGGPFDLAVGDLNRDGRPDIVVANADSNAITVLLNRGRGDFAPPVDVPFAENPRGVALGDFNRDGVLDIVATKYLGSTIEILYGAGDGTFPTRRSLTSPTNAQGVAVADFNNDGWLDAVVASTNGTISILSMNATGATRRDLHPSGDGWNVVTTGDFDHDGRVDVAVASTAGSVVQVLYNKFDWGSVSNPVPVAASPRGIAAGDLNRDGVLELVVAGRAASTVSVVTRVTDATLSVTGFAAGSGARTVALADFNRNGRIGIATANEFGNSASVFSNGTNLTPAAFAFERAILPSSAGNHAFGVGDFNHNGKLDIARGNVVLLDGTTESRVLGPGPGRPGSGGGAVGDFNGDGNLDVAYTFFGRFQVFFGDGAGGFRDGPSTSTTVAPVTGSPYLLRQADMNRDGRADLVILASSDSAGTSGMEIWLGRGDGTFAKSTRVDGSWGAAQIADLDRDGALDVVVSGAANGVSAFLGDGRGGIKRTTTYGAGTPRFGFDLADVNEDGVIDLVVADGQVYSWGTSWSSKLTVARGVGDGTFETLDQYDTSEPGGVFRVLYGLVVGDLNGDGHVDIFTSHADFMPGDGAGNFAAPAHFVGEAVRDSMLVDVNGDGLLDVLGYTIYGREFAEVTMINTLRTPNQNRPPAGLEMGGTMVWPYDRFWWDTDENEIDTGLVTDPDMHDIRYRWVLANGTVVSTWPWWTPNLSPGSYQVTVTASDERGGSMSDTFTLDVPPFKETVLLPANSFGEFHGAWQHVDDPTAAWGARMWHPDAGAPKRTEPLANPTDYFDLGFVADPTQDYKLWIRLKADGDNWANDSVFVQFTGAKDAAGNPIYEIGTTSALAVNLEECSGCGESGWGWEDDGWGAVNRNGVTLRFPEGGVHTIRIQTREDGVSIDQIVLSSEKYKTARPGAAKNDTVKLNPAGPEVSPRR